MLQAAKDIPYGKGNSSPPPNRSRQTAPALSQNRAFSAGCCVARPGLTPSPLPSAPPSQLDSDGLSAINGARLSG